MKAMILAAGLGTRLRPLTDDRPKALVEISDRTLLEIALTRLRSFGIHDVIINVHHLAGMVVDYLKKHDNFDMNIEVSREEVLLDTGGGLKKAAHFFEGDAVGIPAVVKNGSSCIMSMSSAPSISSGCCNFTMKISLWRRWRCRSARLLVTCCSTRGFSFAAGGPEAIKNLNLSGLHLDLPGKRRRWLFAAST